jgi:hypothetical protein
MNCGYGGGPRRAGQTGAFEQSGRGSLLVCFFVHADRLMSSSNFFGQILVIDKMFRSILTPFLIQRNKENKNPAINRIKFFKSLPYSSNHNHHPLASFIDVRIRRGTTEYPDSDSINGG